MKPAAARPPHRASCLARPMSAATLAWLVFLAIAMEGAPVPARANMLDPSETAESTQLLLGIPHDTDERLAGIGAPMGIRASSGGVTVTLDRVVGDRTLIICVFSVAYDDGSPFDAPVRPGMASAPMITFGSATAEIASWDLFFADFPTSLLGIPHQSNIAYGSYDADPDDAAFQFIFNVLPPDPIRTGTVSLHFEDLVCWEEHSRRTIAEGTWDFEFSIPYGDSTVVLPAGQTLELEDGASVTFDNVLLSPLGVYIDFALHELPNDRVSEELARFPIALAMRDGSIVELGEDGGCSLIDGTGKGWRGARPASFVDCGEVASVLIGDDIVIPVAEANT